MNNQTAVQKLREQASRMLQLADEMEGTESRLFRSLSKREKELIRLACVPAMREFCDSLVMQYVNGGEPDDMGHSLDAFMAEHYPV